MSSNWFWAEKGVSVPLGGQALVEPKRKFRWILQVNGIPMWTIKKVDKPSITISTAEHVFINHKFYYPGRVEYNEISFTIVDSVNPDAAETLRQMLHAGGYRYPYDGEVATQSMTKEAMVRSLGDVHITHIGGGGWGFAGAGSVSPDGSPVDANGVMPGFHDKFNVYENWYLKNAFVTALEFGDLDYTSDDLSEITIKMRYDFAVLNDPDHMTPSLDMHPPDASEVSYTPAPYGLEPTRND
tara:strand:- start:2082 stop:2804 length:723 start_codon:yes stop_codon:yes gene_type:complete